MPLKANSKISSVTGSSTSTSKFPASSSIPYSQITQSEQLHKSTVPSSEKKEPEEVVDRSELAKQYGKKLRECFGKLNDANFNVENAYNELTKIYKDGVKGFTEQKDKTDWILNAWTKV